MTISKTTELGTITFSDLIFADIIDGSFRQEQAAGRVWPSTKRGRQIGNDLRFQPADLAGSIEVEESFDNHKIDIEFYIIIKFGAGITAVTDILCDYIAETIKERYHREINQIRVKITGVKSKQIAKRDFEVIKQYGDNR